MTTATEPVTLQYVPLPPEIAEHARTTLTDAFGHALHVVKETGPCRVCLRYSTEPEDYILMSYRPLADRNPYAEIGPVFIHAHDCEPYATRDEFPPDFASRPLVVRAYDQDGRIADAAVAQPGEAQHIAADFLRDSAIAEVHVRNVSYTCYDFKIVRV